MTARNLGPATPDDERVYRGETTLTHDMWAGVAAKVHAYRDGLAWLSFRFANTLDMQLVGSAESMRELGEHLIAAANASEAPARPNKVEAFDRGEVASMLRASEEALPEGVSMALVTPGKPERTVVAVEAKPAVCPRCLDNLPAVKRRMAADGSEEWLCNSCDLQIAQALGEVGP